MLLSSVMALAALASGQSDRSIVIDRIVERTRTTAETYFLVSTNRITPNGVAPITEWASEANSGPLHRVETPRDRLVANCKTGWGAALRIQTGEVSHGAWIAKAACGIDANKELIEKRYLGRSKASPVLADRLLLRDAKNVRTYDVASNGAIIGASIADADGTRRLITRALFLTKKLPYTDCFTQASLARSIVSEAAQRDASKVENWATAD